MRRHDISPALRSQVLTLGRELHNASVKFKAGQLQDESPPPRSFFIKQKRPDRPEGNTHGMVAFTQNFGLALDRYRDIALPMYAVSPIEVVLFPLGIISHSSCGLVPFLNGILDFEQVMEYRVGVVRTIEFSSKYGRVPIGRYLLVQCVNGRGVENWVRLELHKPIDGASVSFANTKQALTQHFRWSPRTIAVEDTLPVTSLARQFKVLCDVVNSVGLNRVHRKNESIFDILGRFVQSRWSSDEDFLSEQSSLSISRSEILAEQFLQTRPSRTHDT